MREGSRLLFNAVAYSPRGLVVLLDLDDMRKINCKFGTRVGDQLLARVESALQETTNGRGGASHLGGDQFLAVITGFEEPDPVVRDLLTAVRRARVRSARVTASAGICLWSEGIVQPHDLLTAAALALEQVKLAARAPHRWGSFRSRYHYQVQPVVAGPP
jgi:diguanylate cyclase (GGDEF)-like protein